ncbi:MAG: hypothetical protein OXN84_06615 [Albidovulum sp.]|nr:hypothetical protein [Albidovulum sp.]
MASVAAIAGAETAEGAGAVSGAPGDGLLGETIDELGPEGFVQSLGCAVRLLEAPCVVVHAIMWC